MSENAVLEPTQVAVAVTPAAVQQIKRLRAKKGGDHLGVRLGVKGGGCSGLSYVMRFEERPADTDAVYDFDGLTVMVDPRSARFLAGVTLDYSTANLLDGGWKWLNPNAAKSCGCGTSFTPK